MDKRRKIIAIVNPNSGTKNKSKVLTKLSSAFSDPTFDLSILQTEYAGHAIELSSQGIRDQAETIVAIGGDGTVNEISSALIDTETKLGVISMGSGNGFSRHSGIHGSIDNAIEIIKNGYSELIDTCTLNGTPYVNLAGIGIDGEVAYLTKTNSIRGLLPYILTTFKAKGLTRSFAATVCYDNKCIKGDFRTIVVANAQRYGFNFKIAPLASIQDGLLDIIMIKDAPFWKYLLDFPKFINGDLAISNLVEIFKSEQVDIKLDQPQFHHIDGEGLDHNNLEFKFKIKPSSLHLIIDKNSNLKL